MLQCLVTRGLATCYAARLSVLTNPIWLLIDMLLVCHMTGMGLDPPIGVAIVARLCLSSHTLTTLHRHTCLQRLESLTPGAAQAV